MKKTKAVPEKYGMETVAFQDAMAAVKYGYNYDVIYTKNHHDAYLALTNQYRVDGYYVKPLQDNLQNENLLIGAVAKVNQKTKNEGG